MSNAKVNCACRKPAQELYCKVLIDSHMASYLVSSSTKVVTSRAKKITTNFISKFLPSHLHATFKQHLPHRKTTREEVAKPYIDGNKHFGTLPRPLFATTLLSTFRVPNSHRQPNKTFSKTAQFRYSAASQSGRLHNSVPRIVNRSSLSPENQTRLARPAAG